MILGENPSWDLTLLFFAIASTVLLGLIGRSRLTMLAISTYLTIAIISLINIPSLIRATLNLGDDITTTLLIIASILFASYILISITLQDIINLRHNDYAISAIISVSITGLIIAYIFTILPPATIEGMSAVSKTTFSGPIMLLTWLIAPIAVIGLTRK